MSKTKLNDTNYNKPAEELCLPASALRVGDIVVRRHRAKAKQRKLHDIEYTVVTVCHYLAPGDPSQGEPLDHYIEAPSKIEAEVEYADGSVGDRIWYPSPLDDNRRIVFLRPVGRDH